LLNCLKDLNIKYYDTVDILILFLLQFHMLYQEKMGQVPKTTA